MHDGDLVVNGSLVTPPPPEHPDPAAARPVAAAKGRARFAARIASTGETRWILMMRSHHQLETTARGEILVLTEATVRDERSESLRERLGERMGSLVLHDNLLRWLSVDGSLIDTLSLLDAIDAGGAAFPFADPERLLEGPKHIGLFHCNSAYSMDQPHLEGRGPLYDADNVLTTSRNQDRVFIVNRESRSLVWAWGRDELQAPHSATWLPNGNFLVFDNGVDRERSRVIEVDPEERAIVWQYPPDMQGGGIEFFTKSRGMAQRLDNGNTLIVESNAGKAFEITPSGGLVWQYHTPLTDEGKRPVLITLRRYPKSWLEVALPEQPAPAARHPKR